LSAADGEIAQIEILICPSDPAVTVDQPLLSYAANAGWIERTAERQDADRTPARSRFQGGAAENAANGVFFSRIRGQSTNRRLGRADNNNGDPTIKMTPALIKDGLSQTIMLTENLRAVNWTYVLEEEFNSSGGTGNQKYHFGVCWEQPNALATAVADNTADRVRRINGNTESESAGNNTNNMTINDGFPSSLHPGGVNVAFMGGSVSFLGDNISPAVFAQIMTSDRKNSDLHTGDGSNRSQYEENLPIVSDADF